MIHNPARIEVLLVEDDDGDVLITREALEESTRIGHLHVVGNGEEAMAYLRRQGEYAAAVRPHLVLLDLNLPRMDGREVLAEVKADPDLRRIPIVVFTTSDAEEDIIRSYDLHANAYVRKPVDYAAITDAIRRIDDFFLNLAHLPPR